MSEEFVGSTSFYNSVGDSNTTVQEVAQKKTLLQRALERVTAPLASEVGGSTLWIFFSPLLVSLVSWYSSRYRSPTCSRGSERQNAPKKLLVNVVRVVVVVVLSPIYH